MVNKNKNKNTSLNPEDYDKLLQSAIKNKEKLTFKAFSIFLIEFFLNNDIIIMLYRDLKHAQPGFNCEHPLLQALGDEKVALHLGIKCTGFWL